MNSLEKFVFSGLYGDLSGCNSASLGILLWLWATIFRLNKASFYLELLDCEVSGAPLSEFWQLPAGFSSVMVDIMCFTSDFLKFITELSSLKFNTIAATVMQIKHQIFIINNHLSIVSISLALVSGKTVTQSLPSVHSYVSSFKAFRLWAVFYVGFVSPDTVINKYTSVRLITPVITAVTLLGGHDPSFGISHVRTISKGCPMLMHQGEMQVIVKKAVKEINHAEAWKK